MNTADLWNRLHDAGMVQGDPPAPNEDAAAASWPIRILLGIAGWLAALFLLAFFFILIDDLFGSETGMLVLGGVLCAAATWLFRLPRQDFMQQFALAMALAGQLFVWFGIFELFEGGDIAPSLLVGLFEIGLIALMPNYLHRVLATLAGGCFFYAAAMRWGYPFVFDVLLAALFSLLWLNEGRWAGRIRWVEPVGIALALLLAGSSIGFMRFHTFLYRYEGTLELLFWLIAAAKIFIAAVFVWSVAQLLRQVETPWRSPAGMAALAGSALLALLCLRTPGMLPALLLLLIAFGRGHRFMMALGLIAVIGYGIHYYYVLDYTLLMKSGVLAVTGAALLLARVLMRRLGARHA